MQFTPEQATLLNATLQQLTQDVAFRLRASNQGIYPSVYVDTDWNLIQSGLMDPVTRVLILPTQDNTTTITTQSTQQEIKHVVNNQSLSSDHSSPPPQSDGQASQMPTPNRRAGRPRKPTIYDNLPEGERHKAKMRDYMRGYRSRIKLELNNA